MRLVVTGASGFIGRNVLLRAPRDWKIIAVYNRTAGLEAFVAANGLSHVTPVRCDLTSAADALQLSRTIGGRVDAALYLAANGDPAESATRPRWDLESNTVALVTFLEHCAIDHLVYLSSGAVYDGLNGPVSPSTPVTPGLPYAISKLASEQYVRFFAARRHVLINVTPVYDGPAFVTVQNVSAVYCAYRIFNRQELVGSLESAGYRLVDSWAKPRRFRVPGHPDKSFDQYSGFYFRAR